MATWIKLPKDKRWHVQGALDRCITVCGLPYSELPGRSHSQFEKITDRPGRPRCRACASMR